MPKAHKKKETKYSVGSKVRWFEEKLKSISTDNFFTLSGRWPVFIDYVKPLWLTLLRGQRDINYNYDITQWVLRKTNIWYMN